MRQLDGITDSMDVNLGRLQKTVREGSLACCGPWSCGVAHDLATEQEQQQ